MEKGEELHLRAAEFEVLKHTVSQTDGALSAAGRPGLVWESLIYNKKSRRGGRDFPERESRE